MYTSTVFNAMIRDAAAPYGGGWLEREGFPAEGVLRDLRRAGGEGASLRVVARYSVVRYVLLRLADADPSLVVHAREAALEHLAAVGPRWPEGVELRRVVERPEPVEPATGLLAGAAREAELDGHRHGAYAIRRAAYLLARQRGAPGRAAQLATGMAAFLRRHGEARRARVWQRRADRLLRLEDGSPAPSTS